jgi:peptide/nickel transport system substrate-binding protein
MWFNLTSAEPGTQARTGKRWFASQNFRKAICSAVDREAIVNNVFQGKATAAVNLLSSANPVWFSPEIETCQFDPDRSRDLLSGEGFQWKRQGSQEVLYDSSGSPVTFELVTRSEDILGKVAAIVQQDLAEIGIELSIRQEEHRAVISRVMGSRDYDSALMKLDMGTEPTLMSGIFLSSGSLHIWNPGQSRPATSWEAEIDQWMGLQAITPDQTERQKIFQQVQRSIADQAVLIPLVHNNVLAAWQKDFRNMRPAQIFPFTLWNVWEISRIEETSN